VSAIEVHGAGLAGSAAAIAARLLGADVDLYDPSPFPRHKVCGEYLSPEILPVLDALGLTTDFHALNPIRYAELTLRFGQRSLRAALPAPAFGLSRFALDHLLLRHAQALGARLQRQRAPAPAPGQGTRPLVRALGRNAGPSRPAPPRGRRLFGFKAHFQGSPPDALTLYFHGSTYVGVNQVEGGFTNVCGIAPESELAPTGFRIDKLLHSLPGFPSLLARLRRSMEWLTTGPLVYGQNLPQSYNGQYSAGDQLSFVDPFTGSGQLLAILTGTLAGASAALNLPVSAYSRLCRDLLRRPFLAASLIRSVLRTPLAPLAAECIPVSWLVRATRPAITGKALNVLGLLQKGKPADTRRKIPAGRFTHLGEASGPTGDG